MQIISLKNRKKALQEAIKVLKSGGIVAHPTDTCYGFAAMIFSKKAIVKLYRLKKMSKKKPVSILVSSIREAKKYGVWNKTAEALARKFWPGAFTLVVKRKESLPNFLNPGTETIGIRISADRFSKSLVKRLASPVTTTSANITGLRTPYSVKEIIRQFKNQKMKSDLIINGGALSRKNPPSSVIDVVWKTLRVIREGKIPMSKAMQRPLKNKP